MPYSRIRDPGFKHLFLTITKRLLNQITIYYQKNIISRLQERKLSIEILRPKATATPENLEKISNTFSLWGIFILMTINVWRILRLETFYKWKLKDRSSSISRFRDPKNRNIEIVRQKKWYQTSEVQKPRHEDPKTKTTMLEKQQLISTTLSFCGSFPNFLLIFFSPEESLLCRNFSSCC